jgi:ferredoxin
MSSQDALSVTFARSGLTVAWVPGQESLLTTAEAAGIDAPFVCRSGVCGTCVTRLQAGAVAYSPEPLCDLAADEILLCCSQPTESVTLDL